MQATSIEGMVTVEVFHTSGPNHAASQFVLYIIRYQKIVIHKHFLYFSKQIAQNSKSLPQKSRYGCNSECIHGTFYNLDVQSYVLGVRDYEWTIM